MIDLAIALALLSLVLGGLNEVLFKRYSARPRSRGMMIAGGGAVWAALLLCEVQIRGGGFHVGSNGLQFGLAAGLALALANILLLEALRHIEVSLGSTIYRLNTIGVVVLAVLLLDEPLTAIKLAGISCGVIAVLLLYRHHHQSGGFSELRLGLILVLSGSLCRAVFGVVSKIGLEQGADGDLLLLIAALCWVASGIAYARFIERDVRVSRSRLGYWLLSGVIVYGIVRSLLGALALGEASVVIPIANLSFLVVLSLALVLGMERINLRKSIAMGFAVAAIVFLTQA